MLFLMATKTERAEFSGDAGWHSLSNPFATRCLVAVDLGTSWHSYVNLEFLD